MAIHDTGMFTAKEINRLEIDITTGALAKRPGMTLMFTDHLKLMMIWPHFSHGGNRAVFHNP